jgi:hypothetical protein
MVGRKRSGAKSKAQAIQQRASGWDAFPGSEALQAWALELRAALADTDPDSELWALAGTAVMLVGDGPEVFDTVLERVATDAGMTFISLDGDTEVHAPAIKVFAADGSETEEEDRLAFAETGQAPALVHLRGGRWMAEKHSAEAEEFAVLARSFQSRVRRSIRAFDRKCPVVLVVSADEITSLTVELRASGLFDRFFRAPEQTLAAKGDAFIERLGRDRCAASITKSPAKIGKLVELDFQSGRRVDLALLRFKRMIAREKRQLEFLDLVAVAARGFAEGDAPRVINEEACARTAYHEAGHVVMAIVGSHGQNIPDYVSIAPCA